MGPSTADPAPRPQTAPRRRHGGRRGALPAVAAVALAVALAGCGGQGAEQEHGEAGGTTAKPAATATVPTQTSQAGLVDRAFVAQMIPHHEMAVDMAREAPERAEHVQLRTLARSITTDQEREIDALRAAAKRLGVQPAAGHGAHATMEADAKTLGLAMDDMGMSMEGPDLATAKPFDRAFIDAMVPHHQGAIRMARAQLARGEDPELRKLATAIVTAQEREIRRMNAWRTQWHGAASPAGGVPPA
ncbi:DUF305 domain-containing protein [Patulibacter americanus]|uniref:DUF305 domain-containing protein n=1 Tax=Patulibacter americanus TaxID=588672 RepID=UPI0003B7534F|nr:DUF305 domain-containing protein [Patulibacter americanus]